MRNRVEKLERIQPPSDPTSEEEGARERVLSEGDGGESLGECRIVTTWEMPSIEGQEYDAVSTRAEAGDEGAISELRTLLGPDEWRKAGDLARQVCENYLERIVGEAPSAKMISATVRSNLAEIQRELLGQKPSMLETLLVKQIVVSHLAMYRIELRLASLQSFTHESGDYWERQLSRAHWRYIMAINALIQLRQPMGPNVPQPRRKKNAVRNR